MAGSQEARGEIRAPGIHAGMAGAAIDLRGGFGRARRRLARRGGRGAGTGRRRGRRIGTRGAQRPDQGGHGKPRMQPALPYHRPDLQKRARG